MEDIDFAHMSLTIDIDFAHMGGTAHIVAGSALIQASVLHSYVAHIHVADHVTISGGHLGHREPVIKRNGTIIKGPTNIGYRVTRCCALKGDFRTRVGVLVLKCPEEIWFGS